MLECRERNSGRPAVLPQSRLPAISVLRSHYDDTCEDAYIMQFRLDASADTMSPFAPQNRSPSSTPLNQASIESTKPQGREFPALFHYGIRKSSAAGCSPAGPERAGLPAQPDSASVQESARLGKRRLRRDSHRSLVNGAAWNCATLGSRSPGQSPLRSPGSGSNRATGGCALQFRDIQIRDFLRLRPELPRIAAEQTDSPQCSPANGRCSG